MQLIIAMRTCGLGQHRVHAPQLKPGEDESRREALLRALSPLPPRDRKILLMYYGLETGEPMTMEQIATVFGVTRERVRQLRDRALAAVRDGDAAKALRRDWAA